MKSRIINMKVSEVGIINMNWKRGLIEGKNYKYESIEGKNWKNENIKVGMSNIKILNVRIICNNLLKVISIIMKI